MSAPMSNFHFLKIFLRFAKNPHNLRCASHHIAGPNKSQWVHGKHCSLFRPLCTKSDQGTAVTSKGCTDEEVKSHEAVADDLISSVIDVASSLPGDPDKIKFDLLHKLQAHSDLIADQRAGASSSRRSHVSDILGSLNIFEQDKHFQYKQRHADRFQRMARRYERAPPALQEDVEDETLPRLHDDKSQNNRLFQHDQRTGRQYEDDWRQLRRDRQSRVATVRLFDAEPLRIFTRPSSQQATQKKQHAPSLWDVVREEELRDIQMSPPRHGFDEMMQWTRQGKLWKFPTDNEQGWEEESNVGFHEHVFLDDQISDFPTKGPIRHFMELVTTALSQNPYLSVRQKHEHIDWFRDYFMDKQEIIEETIVMKAENVIQQSEMQ